MQMSKRVNDVMGVTRPMCCWFTLPGARCAPL